MTLDLEYVKWRREKHYDAEIVYIDGQREHAFTDGRSIGFRRGIKYGIAIGILLTLLGSGLANQMSKHTKNLEDKSQTSIVQVLNSR